MVANEPTGQAVKQRQTTFPGIFWERFRANSAYFLLATGAILLVLVIWVSVDARIRTEQDNATSRALDRASSAARSFEQYALRTIRAADNLTRMAVVSLAHNAPDETIRRALQTDIVDGEIFHSLNIQDAQANLIGSTISPLRPLNYADRAYFREAMEAPSDTLVIGTPVSSRLTGEPVIPVARRFNAPDGSVGGIVLVQVRADAFERGYRDLDLQGMDYVALIGLDGIARAGSIGGTSMHGRDFSTSNVVLHQRQEPQGWFSATAITDGVARHVAYRTLEDYPLFVAFGVDTEVAQADFEKLKTEVLVLGGLATALVVAFTGGIGYAMRQKDDVNKQLRAREDTLRELATRDHLTGLPNRVTLETVATGILEEAHAEGAEVACIFIDLDRFGDINAALGHQVGDEVLKAVAASLLRPVQDWGHVARIGGDEFVVIFRTAGDSDTSAMRMAEHLRESIETVKTVERVSASIKASIGGCKQLRRVGPSRRRGHGLFEKGEAWPSGALLI